MVDGRHQPRAISGDPADRKDGEPARCGLHHRRAKRHPQRPGLFRPKRFFEQLEWQVVVQSEAAGPFQFGFASRVAAGPNRGAISLTWVEVNSANRREEVRRLTRQIAAELRHLPGFLGWMGDMVESRMFTVTVWETPEHAPLVGGGKPPGGDAPFLCAGFLRHRVERGMGPPSPQCGLGALPILRQVGGHRRTRWEVRVRGRPATSPSLVEAG